MTPDPTPCACGRTPEVVRIIGSGFGLRVFGCVECKITGPARMTTEKALEEWNAGHRVGRNGERICECCKEVHHDPK